jgi:hypothetical protein
MTLLLLRRSSIDSKDFAYSLSNAKELSEQQQHHSIWTSVAFIKVDKAFKYRSSHGGDVQKANWNNCQPARQRVCCCH